ncbi:hypothetical protein QE422_003260 [Chryseobacterium sp. SORGH_AS 447]|uniref:hypothetical protein n=1 Tax=Chryseobacterium sp. SORGH_AS_0447 TaxID=3041769 RepID=UPI002785ACEB|nr:hypothetical protein [Chryseobacterium sp. SORGH_AS_0447]MDQ1162892.1 hypothetical protein [Chryseobacterium sp. SORGH_AS_0447]
MEKHLSAAALLLFSAVMYSQVGINNQSPKATLDITAKTTDGSKPEGIIIPRLTGDQIKSADLQYTSDQKSTVIYATAAVGSASTKTAAITEEGYYYFDGNIWQRIAAATANNGLTKTGNNIQLGGAITKTTSISGISANNKLTFTGSGVDAINFGSNTLSVDADNSRIGIGTSSPTQQLDVSGTARLRTIPSSGGTVMLTADNDGVIRKQALPTASAPVILATLSTSGVTLTSSNWGNFNYTGTYITLPANSKYLINTTQLMTAANNNAMPTGQAIWLRSSFSDSSTSFSTSPDIVGSTLMSGSWCPSAKYALVSGTVTINNTSSNAKTYYYWAGDVDNNGYTGDIYKFGGNAGENQMYGLPVN